MMDDAGIDGAVDKGGHDHEGNVLDVDETLCKLFSMDEEHEPRVQTLARLTMLLVESIEKGDKKTAYDVRRSIGRSSQKLPPLSLVVGHHPAMTDFGYTELTGNHPHHDPAEVTATWRELLVAEAYKAAAQGPQPIVIGEWPSEEQN